MPDAAEAAASGDDFRFQHGTCGFAQQEVGVADEQALQGARFFVEAGKSHQPLLNRFPRKQRMPNQHGGTDPVSKFVKLTAHEASVGDEEFVQIHGEGTATTKSAYNKRFADSIRATPSKD